jgi:uncharacterized Zn finger protein (UPF0148 family)
MKGQWVCSSCHSPISPNAEPNAPCPICGRTARTFNAEPFTVQQGQTAILRSSATSPNESIAHGRQLAQAVTNVESAAEARHVQQAQDATRYALELIHELNDDLTKRSEWSQAGWPQETLTKWEGLLGARNASHHKAATVVALTSDPAPNSLRWAEAIPAVNSQRQGKAYRDRLADEPVVPLLKEISGLIKPAATVRSAYRSAPPV